MNVFSEIKKSAVRFLALIAVACPMLASCQYDDSELWEQINDLAIRVHALEQKLNNEFEALSDMVKKSVTITSCEIQSDSTYKITLSTGVEFIADPKPDVELKSVVTYMNLGGVNYWAYYKADGSRELILNEAGERIPVETETPKVVTREDESFLVVGGVEYPLSGNSVFSNYEIIQDEMTGEIYAVKFAFGEDMSFTVTVDGAQGFWFVQQAGFYTSILSDYFVAAGMTERVQLSMIGVMDYVLQVPDGWRVKEFVDELVGVTYFDITAPTTEQVNSGDAVAEGNLKAMVVLEGGKATVAKLHLSSTPFSRIGVSLNKAYITAYPGLQKFVYGLAPKDALDEAAVCATASDIIEGGDVPAGYGYADGSNVVGEELTTLLAQGLTPGAEYVLWALPALLDAETEEFFINEDALATYEFTAYSVAFEVTKENFKGVDVSFSLTGADAYYADLSLKGDFNVAEVVKHLNYGIYEPLTVTEYAGSAFEFIETDIVASPNTEYVAWVVVAEEGKTVFTEDDVLSISFKVTELAAGGNVKVVAAEPVLEATDITVDLSAAGAEMIFYTFVKYNDIPNYTGKEAEQLIQKGKIVDGSSATVKLSDVITATYRQPETSFGFYAMAVDEDGKYGEAYFAELTTGSIPFNDLKVELELVSNNPGDVVVSVSTASGTADGYIYFIGKADNPTWTSANLLGGTAETAERYIAMKPNDTKLKAIANAYPIVNGQIKMTDLALSTDYVVAVVAKGDGLTSRATVLKFKTRSVNIGTVVTSDDSKWAAAKPTVEYIPETFYAAAGQMPGAYGFKVTVPSGFTAYVVAGTDSYLNEGDETLVLSVDEAIQKIIEHVDKPRSNNVTVDPDLWGEKGYPYGFEFYHYEHGNPLFGNAVIWASLEYHDSVCDCGGEFDKAIQVTNTEEGDLTVYEHQKLNINDGTPVEFRQPYAMGSVEKVIDKVLVVCQDLNGNCYEMFSFDVPVELFQNAGARDE